jgi:hypothetical protein
MQGMPAITRAKLLDFATLGFQLFIAGPRVVALFALGAGQSDNISWHGFVLLMINGIGAELNLPVARCDIYVTRKFR